MLVSWPIDFFFIQSLGNILRSPSTNKDSQEKIPESLLPRCKQSTCGGLLRPHVVWFHENLDPSVMRKASRPVDDSNT